MKKNTFSTGEMVIRYNYLLKTIEDRTKQAHTEGRFTWTDKEAKEIHAMIDEAEELRLKLRSMQSTNNKF